MGPQFQPTPGADGWQLSNPPILALAPLKVSLDVFQRAGMANLRAKSEQITGYLESLIRQRLAGTLEIVTPAEPARRGCQLSLRVAGGRARGRALFEHLMGIGIVGVWREPDVIRISPAPLYNRYSDVLGFVRAVEAWRTAEAA
jgi:kynureninase